MHDSLTVHELNGLDELQHDLTGLRLREALFLLDPLEQLATLQVLHHYIGVELKHKHTNLTVKTARHPSGAPSLYRCGTETQTHKPHS